MLYRSEFVLILQMHFERLIEKVQMFCQLPEMYGNDIASSAIGKKRFVTYANDSETLHVYVSLLCGKVIISE